MLLLLFSIVAIYLLIHVLNKLVINKYRLIILKYKVIRLGTLNTKELTILEWKPLLSIKLFYFEKGVAQEIYHTHSFSAISFLIFGNYTEEFYDPATKGVSTLPRNRSTIIMIPKTRFHQITKSEGCLTLMVTGPWGDVYKEYQPKTGELIMSTHGRKQILVEKID